MPKSLIRIVALILVPCMLLDPSSAFAELARPAAWRAPFPAGVSLASPQATHAALRLDSFPFGIQALVPPSWLSRPISWIQRASELARQASRNRFQVRWTSLAGSPFSFPVLGTDERPIRPVQFSVSQNEIGGGQDGTGQIVTTPSGSRFQVFDTPQTMAAAQAGEIAEIIHANDAAGRITILILPTGSTPIPVYHELVRLYQARQLSFRNVHTFNMDEYYPGPQAPCAWAQHPQSYRRFMDELLFSKVDIPRANIHFLNGQAADPAAEAARYEQEFRDLAPNGADLELGGVGSRGHVAFNEAVVHLTDDFLQRLTSKNREALGLSNDFALEVTAGHELAALAMILQGHWNFREGETFVRWLRARIKTTGRITEESLQKLAERLRRQRVTIGWNPDSPDAKDIQDFVNQASARFGFPIELADLRKLDDSQTHLRELALSTVVDNSVHFAEPADIPTQALTMGLGTLRHSQRTRILASTPNKIPPLEQVAAGPVSEQVPVTDVLRHPDTRFLVTQAAIPPTVRTALARTSGLVLNSQPETRNPKAESGTPAARDTKLYTHPIAVMALAWMASSHFYSWDPAGTGLLLLLTIAPLMAWQGRIFRGKSGMNTFRRLDALLRHLRGLSYARCRELLATGLDRFVPPRRKHRQREFPAIALPAAAPGNPFQLRPPTAVELAFPSRYESAVHAKFVGNDPYDDRTRAIVQAHATAAYVDLMREIFKRTGGTLRGVSFLELGAGLGAIVDVLRTRAGVDAQGIEVRREFVQFARDHGVPLIQGTLLEVPLELAGKTFQITFSRQLLDAIETTDRATEGPMPSQVTHEEELRVLATIAALTAPGGWSIHQTYSSNPIPFTDEELTQAGFQIVSMNPRRTMMVLRRLSDPPPSSPVRRPEAAEETIKPEGKKGPSLYTHPIALMALAWMASSHFYGWDPAGILPLLLLLVPLMAWGPGRYRQWMTSLSGRGPRYKAKQWERKLDEDLRRLRGKGSKAGTLPFELYPGADAGARKPASPRPARPATQLPEAVPVSDPSVSLDLAPAAAVSLAPAAATAVSPPSPIADSPPPSTDGSPTRRPADPPTRRVAALDVDPAAPATSPFRPWRWIAAGIAVAAVVAALHFGPTTFRQFRDGSSTPRPSSSASQDYVYEPGPASETTHDRVRTMMGPYYGMDLQGHRAESGEPRADAGAPSQPPALNPLENIADIQLSGHAANEMLMMAFANTMEDGGVLSHAGRIDFVPSDKLTKERTKVTLILPALRQGQAMRMPIPLNRRVDPLSISDPRLWVDAQGWLTAREDTPPLTVTFDWITTLENGSFRANFPVTPWMEREFQDIPPEVRRDLDRALGLDEHGRASVLAGVVEKYLGYNQQQRVQLRRGTWNRFIGEVLETEGRFKGDCDVLATVGWIWARYLGLDAVMAAGRNNRGGGSRSGTNMSHAVMVIRIGGKWLEFDPSKWAPPVASESLAPDQPSADGKRLDAGPMPTPLKPSPQFVATFIPNPELFPPPRTGPPASAKPTAERPVPPGVGQESPKTEPGAKVGPAEKPASAKKPASTETPAKRPSTYRVQPGQSFNDIARLIFTDEKYPYPAALDLIVDNINHTIGGDPDRLMAGVDLIVRPTSAYSSPVAGMDWEWGLHRKYGRAWYERRHALLQQALTRESQRPSPYTSEYQSELRARAGARWRSIEFDILAINDILNWIEQRFGVRFQRVDLMQAMAQTMERSQIILKLTSTGRSKSGTTAAPKQTADGESAKRRSGEPADLPLGHSTKTSPDDRLIAPKSITPLMAGLLQAPLWWWGLSHLLGGPQTPLLTQAAFLALPAIPLGAALALFAAGVVVAGMAVLGRKVLKQTRPERIEIQLTPMDRPYQLDLVKSGGSHSRGDLIRLDLEEMRLEAHKTGVPGRMAVRRVYLEELGHAVDARRFVREGRPLSGFVRPNSPLQTYWDHHNPKDPEHDMKELVAGLRHILFAQTPFEAERALIKLSQVANDPTDSHYWGGRFALERILQRIDAGRGERVDDLTNYLPRLIYGSGAFPDLPTLRLLAKELCIENLRDYPPDGDGLPALSADGSRIDVPDETQQALATVWRAFETYTGKSLADDAVPTPEHVRHSQAARSGLPGFDRTGHSIHDPGLAQGRKMVGMVIAGLLQAPLWWWGLSHLLGGPQTPLLTQAAFLTMPAIPLGDALISFAVGAAWIVVAGMAVFGSGAPAPGQEGVSGPVSPGPSSNTAAAVRRSFEAQARVLAGIPTVTEFEANFPGTIRRVDLGPGYSNSLRAGEVPKIDFTRRIQGRVYQPPPASENDWPKWLDLYVEKDAQALVVRLMRAGFRPDYSNAYGDGLKGVWWTRTSHHTDTVGSNATNTFFTPLTEEDYLAPDQGEHPGETPNDPGAPVTPTEPPLNWIEKNDAALEQLSPIDRQLVDAILQGALHGDAELLAQYPEKVYIDPIEVGRSDEGRTIFLKLETSILVEGRYLTHLRFKGARPHKGRYGQGNQVAYLGRRGHVERPVTVDQEGRLTVFAGQLDPMGGMRRIGAANEYALMQSENSQGAYRTDVPIGWGIFPGFAFENEPLGWAIAGMEGPDVRINGRRQNQLILRSRTNDPYGMIELSQEQSQHLARLIGESICAYHQKGRYHRYPHFGNIGVAYDTVTRSIRSVVLRDLETSVRKDSLSGSPKEIENQIIAWRFRDVIRLIYQFSFRPRPNDPLIGALLRGYFPEGTLRNDDLQALLVTICRPNFLDDYASLFYDDETQDLSNLIDTLDIQSHPNYQHLWNAIRQSMASQPATPEGNDGSATQEHPGRIDPTGLRRVLPAIALLAALPWTYGFTSISGSPGSGAAIPLGAALALFAAGIAVLISGNSPRKRKILTKAASHKAGRQKPVSGDAPGPSRHVYPDPVVMEKSRYDLPKSLKSWSWLARNKDQRQWLRDVFLPRLLATQNLRAPGQIKVVDLGVSTGEVLARTYYEIFQHLIENTLKGTWKARMVGVDRDATVLAEARLRISGKHPFNDISISGPTIEKPTPYSAAVVDFLNSDPAAFQSSVQLEQLDITDHDSLDPVLDGVDLIMVNHVMEYLHPADVKPFLQHLYQKAPQAWLAMENEYSTPAEAHHRQWIPYQPTHLPGFRPTDSGSSSLPGENTPRSAAVVGIFASWLALSQAASSAHLPSRLESLLSFFYSISPLFPWLMLAATAVWLAGTFVALRTLWRHPSRVPSIRQGGTASPSPARALTFRYYSELTPGQKADVTLASLIRRLGARREVHVYDTKPLGSRWGQLPILTRWSLRRFTRNLTPDPTTLRLDALVAYRGDIPMGVYAFIDLGPDRQIVMDNGIYMDADQRQNGYGGKLTKELLSRLAERGYRMFVLGPPLGTAEAEGLRRWLSAAPGVETRGRTTIVHLANYRTNTANSQAAGKPKGKTNDSAPEAEPADAPRGIKLRSSALAGALASAIALSQAPFAPQLPDWLSPLFSTASSLAPLVPWVGMAAVIGWLLRPALTRMLLKALPRLRGSRSSRAIHHHLRAAA